MGPSPSRKIQVEESNVPTTRPLDVALRQPANDNFSAANDNPRPRDAAIRQQGRKVTRVTYKNNTFSQNPSYTSTDQQFNDSYLQQGLQPSVGSVTPYRNVSAGTEYEQRPTQPVTQTPTESNQKTARKVLSFREMQKRSTSSPRKMTLNPKKALLKKLPGGFAEGELKHLADRAFATEVSISIFSWSTWVWLSLQLPLAIMALVFFGLALGWESTVQSLGYVGSALSYLAGLASSAINALSGIDLSQFNPQNFFMITNAATMLIGYCILFAIYLTYSLAGVPCLSGKGTALKQIALIVAGFGYFVPLLNMLPWAFVWVLAVWIYPTGDEE